MPSGLSSTTKNIFFQKHLTALILTFVSVVIAVCCSIVVFGVSVSGPTKLSASLSKTAAGNVKPNGYSATKSAATSKESPVTSSSSAAADTQAQPTSSTPTAPNGKSVMGTEASSSSNLSSVASSVSSSAATSNGCVNVNKVAPCIGSSTTGASGWGSPIFDDEFNESSLNATDWSTGWQGSGITGPVNSAEQDCYDPNQVAVTNGELGITLSQKTEDCAGKAEPYTTGMITTNGKFSYTYGFAEARIWLPGNLSIDDWPAFWQDGQTWPTDGELDILEGLSGQACGHWHGPGSSNDNGVGWNAASGCSTASYTGGWHTFGTLWTADQITWYYDGQNMGTLDASQASLNDNALVGEPQFLALDLAAPSSSVTSPATMKVDYVRVWQ